MFFEGSVVLLGIVGLRMLFFKNRMGMPKTTVLDSLPVAGNIINPKEKFNTKIPTVDPFARHVTQGSQWTDTIPGYHETYTKLVDVNQNQYAITFLDPTQNLYTNETPRARLMKEFV
jgi:hypothetical protein